jgi:hypothetical protein
MLTVSQVEKIQYPDCYLFFLFFLKRCVFVFDAEKEWRGREGKEEVVGFCVQHDERFPGLGYFRLGLLWNVLGILSIESISCLEFDVTSTCLR